MISSGVPLEVESSKQYILTQLADQREKTNGIAQELARAEAFGAGNYYANYATRIAAIIPSDVHRVVLKYFTDHNRTVVHVIPK